MGEQRREKGRAFLSVGAVLALEMEIWDQVQEALQLLFSFPSADTG